MKYVFAADIGTTSLKACIFDENLNIISSCSKGYKLDTRGDCIEFAAEEYFNIFLSAYEELTKAQPVDGIAIDTQGETMIVADEKGRPLYPAINWLDTRAAAEANLIEKHFGKERIYSVTGQPDIPAGFPAPKLLWLKSNRPQVFEKIKKVFLLEDYILYRLTGNFVTERTMQSSSLYLDITTGGYWQEMLDFLGISQAALPALKESGEYAGEYKGVAVFCGALDQISGMIGAGISKSGQVSEMTGTTLALCAAVDDVPKWHEGLQAPCHYFAKGRYAVIMWSGTAGMALEWFKDGFCGNQSFREIDQAAAKIPHGCEGLTFLPYLTGSTMPKCNPNARGAFCGIELKHTSAHFSRAIMESVACILRQYLDCLDTDTEEIVSIGGGANSKLWCQIKADITGKIISTVQEKETACAGTAILAFKGLNEKTCPKIAKKDVFEPILDEISAKNIYDRFIDLDKILN